MAFEVDFLAVGDGERNGDAIALRYSNPNSPDGQTVIVIDGGNKASGARLVERVRQQYGSNRVDIAISTHPDADHASGLQVVLEQLNVATLLMHRPWRYAKDIEHLFDGSMSTSTLSKRLKEALAAAHEAERIALAKRVEIIEPFAGYVSPDRKMCVLGPSAEYYTQLLPQFERTPAPHGLLAALLATPQPPHGTLLTGLTGGWEKERPDRETLQEHVVDPCRAANNSSVITYFWLDGQGLLFTGDAGVTALQQAIGFADAHGLSLSPLTLLQVPHHGSRRNVSPSVLDRIAPRSAYISAAVQGAPKHPSKSVVNAIITRQRRQYGQEGVFVTQGMDLVHRHETPQRPNWGPAPSMSFSEWVEAPGS